MYGELEAIRGRGAHAVLLRRDSTLQFASIQEVEECEVRSLELFDVRIANCGLSLYQGYSICRNVKRTLDLRGSAKSPLSNWRIGLDSSSQAMLVLAKTLVTNYTEFSQLEEALRENGFEQGMTQSGLICRWTNKRADILLHRISMLGG